jgi:hypothetical protein
MMTSAPAVQKMKLGWALFSLLAMTKAFGYGQGVTTYPLPVGFGGLTTEYVGIIAKHSSQGLQTRYTHKLNESVAMDGGFGFSDSTRDKRLFIGTDVEVFPDYAKQPRFSVKGFFEHAVEFDNKLYLIGAVPTVSKAVSLGGQICYPFFALPVSLQLNNETKKYGVRTWLAFGGTSAFKFRGTKDVILGVEGNINVNDAFTALYAHVTLPFE